MKNILLIGGSYGIGLALAKEIMHDCNVFIASRTNENLSDIGVTHIPFNSATDTFDVSQLPENINGLVYLPGTINLKPFKNLKPEHFMTDMQVNFFDMVKVVQTLMPKLTATGNASIVLFSSVAAIVGMPYHTSIAAAKGAIEGFSRALAAEYAPGVRINVVAPSLTNTPLAEKFLNNELKQNSASMRHPLKRVGTPEDIAAMAAYLLSEKSSWITGQTFHVDGGMSTLINNHE